MSTEWALLAPLVVMLRTQWRRAMECRDAGMTTETVILLAILAALAIGVCAIIVAKITDKANSIPTG